MNHQSINNIVIILLKQLPKQQSLFDVWKPSFVYILIQFIEINYVDGNYITYFQQ